MSRPEHASMLADAMLRWFDDLAVQGIMTTDTNLHVVSWNHWLEVHSGRRAGDVIGRRLTDVWPDLTARGFDQHYAMPSRAIELLVRAVLDTAAAFHEGRSNGEDAPGG